ncbi:MAG: transcriptional repressor [Acidimicrobiia bacterium]
MVKGVEDAADATWPSEQLRRAGLRVTAPRVMVLRALARTPHASVDQVLDVVRRESGAVSAQGVADVLRACTEAGIVRRIEPARSPARYELRVADNHHHLICRRCGVVVDVDCAVGRAPCLDAADDHGFLVDEAEVVYWGRCPECRTTSASSAPGESSVPGESNATNASRRR